MDSSEEIAEVYRRRLDERNAALERFTKRDRLVADLRLVAFLVLVVLGILIVRGTAISLWWLAVPGVSFAALLFVHEPIRRTADRARRSVQFYSNGLGRLEGRWQGLGTQGLSYLDNDHPYAADLDIFGSGSLFERICTAQTRAGEDRLAAWLLSPANPETVFDRQDAVRELRPQLDLREDLELLGAEIREGIDPKALADWGTAQRAFPGPAVPVIATVLGALGTAALVGWFLTDIGLSPLLIVLVIGGIFAHWVSGRVKTVLSAVEKRTADLILLSELIRRLETHQFHSPLLKQLVRSLETGGIPASKQIRRLARLLHLLDYRRNQFFAPLAILWLWTPQFATRIDAWRSVTGPRIVHWLKSIGDFEALCALSAYAAENPTDIFPRISQGGALFETRSVGHPLIVRKDCVMNDVMLGDGTLALMVSGSNMSGKSTLLRTVGVNAVLALAGGPVPRPVFLSRRSRSAPRCGSRIRCKPGSRGSTPRSLAYARWSTFRAGRCRFCSCLTSYSTAPIPTIGVWERNRS